MATDVLYVFVDSIDVGHLIDTISLNFTDPSARIALCGTVQFMSALHAARAALAERQGSCCPNASTRPAKSSVHFTQPQRAGCVLVDGRFHPSHPDRQPACATLPLRSVRESDPHERYEHAKMHALRQNAIDAAKGATR